MLRKYFITPIILILFLQTNIGFGQQESELYKKLINLPGVEVTTMEAYDHYTEAYDIFVEQPVDHKNPNGLKFKQHVYLSHTDFNLPVVLNNNGYGMSDNSTYELTAIIKSNQIKVEHRYFGKSIPDTEDWQYMNTEQASDDLYKIIQLFKQIYPDNKFVSTGISKGGQTTNFLKYYHPDAVDVWVPYVAPLNFTREDPRIYEHLKTVGTKECRDKVTAFQRAMLANRDAIIPMMQEYAKENGYTYRLGWDISYEFAVLEYSFSFWQWHEENGCEKIPSPDSSPEELFTYFKERGEMRYISDQSRTDNGAFMYQAYTELGYYGYELEDFKDLLVGCKGDVVSSDILFEGGDKLEFDYELMPKINKFIQEEGNNFLYIYGELDTWSASKVDPGPNTNAVRMVKKNGSHRTRIKTFEGEELEKIYTTLEDWLDIRIEREKK
ncbi:S28 family serine protease [Bacteroidota bacterium]